MTYQIASFDPDSWVDTPAKIMERMFAYFLCANTKQTVLYRGQISAFSVILNETQGDLNSVISETRLKLQEYFSRSFTNVIVEVNESANPTNSSRTGLDIFLSAIGADGVVLNLAKIVQYSDGAVSDIIDKINS